MVFTVEFHSSCSMNSPRPPSAQVSVLSVCPELSDIRLRVNEKRTLNALNCDKNRQTIRWACGLCRPLGGPCGLCATSDKPQGVGAICEWSWLFYRYPMNGKIKTTDMKVNWCVSLLPAPVCPCRLPLCGLSCSPLP